MCLSMFATLLVPLDGGAEAGAVLPLARTVATYTRAKLVLARVVDGQDQPAFAEAGAYLEAVAGSLRQAGLAVEITVPVGNPRRPAPMQPGLTPLT
jgi:nucleotide-binding universal stress UspA family protein